MNTTRCLLCGILGFALSAPSALAAERSALQTEHGSIIGAIREKTAKGMTTADELAPEIKRYDDLVAASNGANADELAEVLSSQATFLLRVVKDPVKAMTVAERLKKDFPTTPAGRRVDGLITSIKQAPPPPSGLDAEIAAIKSKIDAKMRAGKTSEADFLPELAQFDDLYARHKSEKSETVASILFLKASFYAQVLRMPDRAGAIASIVQADFAGTASGKRADDMVTAIARQAAAAKIQESLTVGKMFPDFAETDTAGQPLSIARFRGKVVLVDFWAMWCGPCIAELPNVVKAYEKFHPAGFEIVGVSLDQAGDGPKLAQFTKDNKMPWPQYFDGKFWSTKLATQYGIQSIPATFLLDGEGRIIGRDLRGPALEAALAKALAR